MKRYLILLLLVSSFAQAKSLKCHSSFSDSFMFGTLSVEGELASLDTNHFELSNIKLDYVLSMDELFEDIWAQASVDHANYTIQNKLNYNPRVYKNHIKFEDLYSRDVFGFLDLILPKKSLNKNNMNKAFTGFMIMTAMDDHWGSTVQLNCELQ